MSRKRKAGQPHKGWKGAAKKRHEIDPASLVAAWGPGAHTPRLFVGSVAPSGKVYEILPDGEFRLLEASAVRGDR